MGESTKQHLAELLRSFDTAMFITHNRELVHARPMTIAGVEGAQTVWFVTSQWSPKSDEIRRDTRVSATFQGDKTFVALSGHAELVKDRAKVKELWKPSWKVWFPDGADDPSLVLIRVTATDAEFWDNAGAKGIRYAFEMAKAVLTHDTPPENDPARHGRVKEPGGPSSRPH